MVQYTLNNQNDFLFLLRYTNIYNKNYKKIVLLGYILILYTYKIKNEQDNYIFYFRKKNE